MMELMKHKDRWENCTACRLGTGWEHNGIQIQPRLTRRHLGFPVLYRMSDRGPSVFSPQRDIVFVGEAPGPSEDSLGAPFIGPAGKVLDCMIEDCELTSYAITNVIACFPVDPDKLPERRFRDPADVEAKPCAARVADFLSIVKPKGVVLLGKHAKRFVKPSFPFVCLLHPSAIGMEDNYTDNWDWRRRNNVSYKRARDTLLQFLETVL